MTATPSRPPGANGWYNSPLTVTFSGTDATSGIEACSQATYAGPDNANAAVVGTCRDRAGNVTPASFALKYDATPPALGAFSVKPANQKAHLRWKAPDDAASVQLVRAPGLKGAAESVVFTGTALSKGYVDRGLRPGRNYVYRLTAADAAANQASKTLEFLARGALLFPAPGERVTRPPLLVWEKARRRELLQRDPHPRTQGLQRLAAARAIAAAARLDVPRPALQAASGHVQLVRVARTRRALGRTVREEARRQHLHVRRVGLGGNVRGHRLLLILGVCGLLLTPSAGGLSEVPGDPTPPVVTPLITGTLGTNGWYVTNVTVNWSVVDPESIILETQGCDARTLNNGHRRHVLSRATRRSDGGETTVTITIRIDKTGPVVTATPSRAPDSNGWYNHALSVGFTGTDATSGMDSCVPSQSYSGPDSANASVSGSCRDRAGNTTVKVHSSSATTRPRRR